MPRVDVKEIKRKLFVSLGKNGDAYWNCLQLFFSGKRIKWELDKTALVLLGPKNIHLHNHLIQAILHNAYTTLPAQSDLNLSPRSAKRRRAMKLADQPFYLREPEQPFIERKLPKLQCVKPAPLFSTPRISQGGSEHQARAPQDFGNSPPLMALRSTMFKLVVSTGLKDVSNDAVMFMMHALEHHLKDVMTPCCKQLRVSKRKKREIGKTTPVGRINIQDMLACMHVSPYLLSQDLPLNLERMLLTQTYQIIDVERTA